MCIGNTPFQCIGIGCTSALAAVGVLSEAVAARMVVRRARDRAVPVELVDALVAGGSRELGSGGAGQASLGGGGSKKSCLHIQVASLDASLAAHASVVPLNTTNNNN